MNKNQYLQILTLSVITGVLLWLAWPPAQNASPAFVAFVPFLYGLFLIEKQSANKTMHTFLFSFFTMVLWNGLTTYWIKNASVFGAVAASVLVNGLLMPLPILLYQWLRKQLPASWHLWCFIAPWLVFEFFHLNWELSWPWLTLGNVFAETTGWIQWYEYTGVLGGSMWILLVNYLLFDLLVKQQSLLQKIKHTGFLIFATGAPFLWSAFTVQQFLSTQNSKPEKKVTFVVVQPNHDPYHEKFDRPPEDLLGEMLQLALQQTDSNTDYLVFPETALTDGITENNNGSSSELIEKLKTWSRSWPELYIISGADTYRIYDSEATATARFSQRSRQWYDVFNAAVQLKGNDSLQFYHKSKLVPGVERMPYPTVFGFLEDFAIELGGTSGSLGSQSEAGVFTGKVNIAPVICYESIFGNYVREYVRKGAQIICIITNDGWWGNTDGYKQHVAYASLRAVETRRCIARSANTGISCFIDATGKRQLQTMWWQPAVIKTQLVVNNTQTWYVRMGDYIGWLAIIMCIALICIAVISVNKN